MKARWATAILLWAAYALPLYDPPAASLIPMPLWPSLLERLFPGVPGWWVGIRVVSLIAAVFLTAGMLRDPFATGSLSSEAAVATQFSTRALRAAFAVAALHAFAGLWAAHFSRGVQLLYIGILAVPTLILTIGRTRGAKPQPRQLDWTTVAAVGALLAAWLPLGALPAWRSPWIVNAIDASMTFEGLARTLDPTFNLLTDEVRPALTALHMVFQGAGILGPVVPLSVPWIQAVNVVWILVTAAGIAALTAIIVGRAAAPIATAVFLFSPYVLMMPMFLASFFFTLLFTVTLLLLAWAIEYRGSALAIVAFGPLAGIAMTHPVLALAVLPVCAHVAWWVLRSYARRQPAAGQRRLPRLVLAIALCTFAAAIVPSLPGTQRLMDAAQLYVGGLQQWTGMEAAALGKVPPSQLEFHLGAGNPSPWDIPISALLAPIAFPRTSLRMLGDALFEPFGTAMALLGIAACWRWRRYGWARALMVLLAVTLLPGFVSTYDRPSLTRMSVLPLVIALLAAVGFQGLAREVAPRLRPLLTMGVSLAIVAGGVILYRVVTPRIVGRTVLGIMLTVVPDEVRSRSALIVPARGDALESELFATQVPVTPISLLSYAGPESLQGADAAPAAELLFWSPGYEDEVHVSRAVCTLWPKAELYTIFDEAGVGQALAARPAGAGWQPAAAPGQWRSAGCDEPPETEGRRADAAIAAARDLAAQGKDGEALEVLRSTARRTFVNARLFETAARTLLQSSPEPSDVSEAVAWATRACQATKFSDVAALDTLSAAYAAQGRFEEAALYAGQAQDAAQSQGDRALAAALSERRAQYERQQMRARR